jgi:cupin fold WbuC family metalloprotein|tara:strand:- start:294 stop:713 length:420 start_codon:yes stop_codon:yes gene_type:complete
MINSIIEIKDKKNIYALIIKKKRRFIKNGVDFLTKDHDLLQLGFIKHKKNHYIKPHIHLKKPRIINYCTEVLLIEKGRVKIKFFNNNSFDIKKDKILSKGDIIILFQGGHGFKILEETKIIEIKQGPYVESKDKKIIER